MSQLAVLRTIDLSWLNVKIMMGLFLVGYLIPFEVVTAQQQDANFQAESVQSDRTVESKIRPRPMEFKRPVLIELHGEIDIRLFNYFNNRMNAAESYGADLVIVEIDSYGGLKNESLDMSRKLRDCDWAYTVALISEKAISGGALIAMGCDEIQIDLDAKFGDIGEIELDIWNQRFRPIEPKIESMLSSDARSIAESKGRSPDLAEALVDKDVMVFVRRDPADENKFLFKPVRVEGGERPEAPWELVPETGPERFLTLSGMRTIELKLANGFRSSREEASSEYGIKLGEIKVYQLGFSDKFAHFLNFPLITGLLVLVGLIALYVEFSAPGIGVGGIIATICVVLFFWSKFLGGTAGWLEVFMFVAGVSFLMLEVFVIPGFGIPGLTGLALIFGSAVLASQNFVIPQTDAEWGQTQTSVITFTAVLCGAVVAAAVLSRYLGALPLFKSLVLAPPPEIDQMQQSKTDADGKPIAPAHPAVSVGDWGEADSLLRPAGRAKFDGRSFDVISDGQFIDPGTKVRVTKIQGNIITVAAIEESDS